MPRCRNENKIGGVKKRNFLVEMERRGQQYRLSNEGAHFEAGFHNAFLESNGTSNSWLAVNEWRTSIPKSHRGLYLITLGPIARRLMLNT